MLKWVFAALSVVLSSLPAHSQQQCNPRDFAFAEYEELQSNYSLYLNALSIMSSNSSESTSKNFGLGVLIPGQADINITGSEAKAVSNSILKYNKKEVSESKSIQYIKTAFRFEEGSFRACIDASNPVKIALASDASYAPEFFLNVGWSPTEINSPKETKVEIKAIGASVDGALSQSAVLPANGSKSFAVAGNDTGFSVSVSVASKVQPPLVFPPKVPDDQFIVVETPMLTTDGKSLVQVASEENSALGPGPNSVQVCASAMPGGVLLPSTIYARIDRQTKGSSSFEPETKNSNVKSACASFNTNGGPGKKTRYEIIGTAYVLQVVPKPKELPKAP